MFIGINNHRGFCGFESTLFREATFKVLPSWNVSSTRNEVSVNGALLR